MGIHIFIVGIHIYLVGIHTCTVLVKVCHSLLYWGVNFLLTCSSTIVTLSSVHFSPFSAAPTVVLATSCVP